MLKLLKFNEKQEETVDRILKHKKGQLVVSGYAGTGKTCVLAHVADKLANKKLRVLCTTFTGKASQRLKEVFGPKRHISIEVTNFHRVIYKTHVRSDGRVTFYKDPNWSNDFDVVLVDESSMIDNQTHRDILSGGIPVVFFGDPFQLPPVGSNDSISSKPDILLDEVFRQRGDSYILDIATDLRNGINRVHELPKAEFDEAISIVNEPANVALFYTNKDRVQFNKLFRLEYDYGGSPLVGLERCVGLQNNHAISLYNGSSVLVRDVQEYITCPKNNMEFAIVNAAWDDKEAQIAVPAAQLGNPQRIMTQDTHALPPIAPLDYAYALTAHKAQGSQYTQVVIKDPVWFAKKDWHNYCRWLYTAITRATDECYLLE